VKEMFVSDFESSKLRVFAMADEVITMKEKIATFEKTLVDFINDNSGGGGGGGGGGGDGCTCPDLTDIIAKMEKINLTNDNIIIAPPIAPDANGKHKPADNKQNILLEDSRVFIGKNEGDFMSANQYSKSNSVAIGNNVAVNGKNGIAIGTNVIASRDAASDSTVHASVAIGNNVTTTGNGLAIGSDVVADTGEVRIGKHEHKYVYLGNFKMFGDYGNTESGALPGVKLISVTSPNGSPNVACRKIDVGDANSLIFPNVGKFRIVSGTKSILIDLTTDNQIIFRNETTSKQASLSLT
jgi:hypothetical protein